MKGYYISPFGGISFQVDQVGLYHMAFQSDPHESDQHPSVDQVNQALDRYFKHQKHDFQLDVHFLTGTPFEREVWQILLSIPYGKTMYYQEVATQIGRPKAVRAVGQACKKNPIGIVVPCHRVIGKDGSMTGYSGKYNIDLKAKLLEHERMMTHE